MDTFAKLLISSAFLVCAASAQANENFTMKQMEDGKFIILDNRTGEVTTCTADGANMVCRAAASDRAALEAEISELNEEVAILERRLAEQENIKDEAPTEKTKPRAKAPETPEAPQTPEAKERLKGFPSDDEIDQFMDVAEGFFQRFFDMVKGLEPPQKLPET